MKKILLSSLIALNVSAFSFAQQTSRVLDKQNMRDGENVEYCVTHKKLNELLQDPANKALWDAELEKAKKGDGNVEKGGPIYKIPVVFHILHNGGVENISDEQIYDALSILNRDYRLQNADANNVNADFDGVVTQGTFEPQPSDVEIEFVLATKAPNGVCFKGITRTQNALTNDGSNGTAQINAIKNGNDVYQGEWTGTKYLNIFVCAEIGGAAGYTQYPMFGGTNMGNGIFALHNYVGSIGTSSVGTSRTLTHEAGHWLNLPHVWGSNNNPGDAASCGTDDGVQDTPNCVGVTACAINSNTCSTDDAFFGFPIRDNVENYMDYSYCSKMFTQGQVTRMRSAIASSTGGRSTLWTTTNLNNTGATGVLTLCKAQFNASKTSVCIGETIDFVDDTYNAATGWTWSFPGGVPSTSTDQNPSVTYSTPGIYEVSLTATDGTTSDAEVKTAYIRVLPAANALPIVEGFESYSTLVGNDQWEVIDYGNNNDFVLETTLGQNSSKSVRLTNFGQTVGTVDELISSAVDLSGVTAATDMTLSFRYAYRKRAAANTEYLKVFVSNNCGEDWVQRKTLSGNGLGSIIATSSWSPVEADWITIHMTNVTSTYWTADFRYKFRFESDGGNNIFLDNINIYTGAPSETLVTVGIDENEGEIEGLQIFPNPTEGELNLQFNVANNQIANVYVTDLAGKILNHEVIQAQAGANLVVLGTDSLATGSYLVQLQVNGTQKAIPFIVK
ncbi:MAG: M43 family zinc metalloprotease [Bacteroidota bacterium]